MDSKHSVTDNLDIADNAHESNHNHSMNDIGNKSTDNQSRNAMQEHDTVAKAQPITQQPTEQIKSAENRTAPTQKISMNKAFESNIPAVQKTAPTKITLPESGFLKAEQLRRTANLTELPPSTRRIKPLNDFLGQHRARAAVETALSLPFDGYNIFAVGTSGLGKRTMLKRMLAIQAAEMPTPSDWVYVNNFANPRQPIALELPPSE